MNAQTISDEKRRESKLNASMWAACWCEGRVFWARIRPYVLERRARGVSWRSIAAEINTAKDEKSPVTATSLWRHFALTEANPLPKLRRIVPGKR